MKYIVFIVVLLAVSCGKPGPDFDATGSFEATEIIVAAEQSGKLMTFAVQEGAQLPTNAIVGTIDSAQLVLKLLQLQAQIAAILSRQPDQSTQLAAIQEQLKSARYERERLTNLVNGGAATQQQLDDANAQINVLEKQLAAQRSTLEKTSGSLHAEVAPLSIQIDQVNDLLNKCNVLNPIEGTVLSTYATEVEMAMMGKPLYKIADLRMLTLRAYISGDQLPQIALGQEVKVWTDAGDGTYNEHQGTISWIADEAEFTPKTIQTKDERAHLVYAIKVLVPNDGKLKIGMYGEVKWQ